VELEKIKKILERYNDGKCTPEESQLIEQWFENIRLKTTLSDNDIQGDLASVQQALNKSIRPTPVRKLRSWYYAAAVVAILAAAGSWFFRHRQQSPVAPGETAQPLADNMPRTSREVANGFVIIRTPKGIQEQLQLEDGSRIILNAGSRLRYPEHFAKNDSRDIYLEEGEAWFDAAPQPGHAFTVHSGNLSTTALGTTFNIRAYAHEQKITVALLTGKVKVTSGNQTPVILQPSERASFDRRSLQLIKSTFQPDDAIGWQSGNLVFKDATYDEISTAIENKYGVTIVNLSNKKDWTYTGNFRQENLKNVIETICLTEALSYRIEKDTVFLENKH
jgi:transmembrane sensor